MTELRALQEQLKAYDNFDQCVVIDVKWLDWGTRLIVDIDYIWKDDGNVRTLMDDRRIVSIHFSGVSELHVIKNLNDDMLNADTWLGWGNADVSWLTVEPALELPRTRLTVPSFRAKFRNEFFD